MHVLVSKPFGSMEKSIKMEVSLKPSPSISFLSNSVSGTDKYSQESSGLNREPREQFKDTHAIFEYVERSKAL